MVNFNFLASRADRFESHFVGNFEDRFCRVGAQIHRCHMYRGIHTEVSKDHLLDYSKSRYEIFFLHVTLAVAKCSINIMLTHLCNIL